MSPLVNLSVVFFVSVCFSSSLASKDEKTYYEVQKLDYCKIDSPPSMPEDWITMAHSCSHLMMKQVKEELRASLTYLAMGAHFSRDTVNRLGFAKYFFDSASEEREHAIKFIGYLTMRGNLTDNRHILELIPVVEIMKDLKIEWNSGAEAIKDALTLETKVTNLIKRIIIECEAGKNFDFQTETINDYHLSDWLTGEFLEEQYKGQRDLAGKLSTLRKMEGTHGKLGEFLFDKKLL